jgi:hypothetical protein
MPTYEKMAELARTCAKNAHIADRKDIAAALWKTARDYQAKAAKLNGGTPPDIGNPPLWLMA